MKMATILVAGVFGLGAGAWAQTPQQPATTPQAQQAPAGTQAKPQGRSIGGDYGSGRGGCGEGDRRGGRQGGRRSGQGGRVIW